MAADADPSSTGPTHPPSPPNLYSSILESLNTLQDTNPWIQNTIQQAQQAQKSIQKKTDSFISAASSRISQIRLTSAAHTQQTLDKVRELKGEVAEYEAKVFGMIKEGILAANPVAAGAVGVGLGLVLLKGPRRFLYYKTLRLFESPEASLSKAENEFKELRQTFERLKAESEKLEKSTSLGEQELKRGRTKLRQAGTLIYKAVRSADKIENRANGLKDALLELPSSDSSRFRTQVSKLVAEVKQERRVLAKEVSKISNYGISV